MNQNNVKTKYFLFVCVEVLRPSQQLRKTEQSINIIDEFHFSEVHVSMNATGPTQS